MLDFFRRYAHVPLGLVSVLLMVVVTAWLLERRVDGVWDLALRITAPIPTAVTIAPSPAVATPNPETPAPREVAVRPDPAPAPPAPPPAAAPATVPAPSAPVDRYVLETGPFLSAETADRVEDQLHRLGYATVRFRKLEMRRLYRVAVIGFASLPDARRAAAELGRGSAVDREDGPEVVLDRLPSLGEAIASARALRAGAYQVRVDDDLGPTVIYHIRYGQFPTHAAADARSEELAVFGLASRVVKVR